MGNASSVNEVTSAQTIGLAKAASIASRLKKGSNGGHAEIDLAGDQSCISDAELEKVYRVFRANDPVLEKSNFISIVKGGNVAKYNSRTPEELDSLLDKIPGQITCEDFKYFVRTISERAPAKRGISVRALEKFINTHKLQSHSVEDFISAVILPQTGNGKCSFASLFAEHVDKGPAAVPPVGAVTHFVCLSNTRKPPFSLVVAALVELEKQLFSADTENLSTGAAMYVWLDMLCLNLHEVTHRATDQPPRRAWEMEDHNTIADQVIKQAQEFVLFLDNWQNPTVFSDGPCLCELFLAQVHSKKAHLLVEVALKAAFEKDALVKNFTNTQQNLARAQDLTSAHFASRAERSRWQAFMMERSATVDKNKLEVPEAVHRLACQAFVDMGLDKYSLESGTKQKAWMVSLAQNTASLAFDIKQYDTALYLYQEALRTVEDAGDSSSKESMSLKLLILEVMEQMSTSTLTLHSSYEEAITLSKKYNGKLHSVTLELMIKYSRNLEDMGNLEQSVDNYKNCLEACEKAKGREDPMTVQTAFALGSVLQQLEQIEDANFYFHRSVPHFQKLFGASDTRTLTALAYYAEVKEDLGALEASEKLYRQRLGNANSKHEDDAELGLAYHDLAAFLTRHGEKFTEDDEDQRLVEAVQLYQDAIRIRAAKLGAQHDDTVLSTNNLAVVLQRLDRVDEAEELLQTSIDSMQAAAATSEATASGRTSRIMSAMSNLAVIQLNNGKMDKSEQMFDKLVASYQSKSKRTFDQDKHFMKVLRNFGNLLIMKSDQGSAGSLDKAVQMYQQAMALFRKFPKEESWSKTKCFMTRDLAICYDKLGEAKHAHKEYRAAYALCQKHLGLLSTETIDVAQHFADFCIQGAKRTKNSASATENLREARALMQRLLDDLQKDNPNPDFLVDGDGRDVDTCYQQDIFDAANTLGLLCDTLNDETEAERNYKLAREGNARLHGYDHESVLAVSYSLAQLYIKIGKLEEALELLLEVLKGYRYLYGEIADDTLEITMHSASCAQKLGHLSQAFELYQDAIDGYAELQGDDALETVRAVAGLAGCMRAMGRLDDAKEKYEQALQGFEDVLGKNDPETNKIRKKLAKLTESKQNKHGSRLLDRKVWQPNKFGKGNAVFASRGSTVDALIQDSQNASFAPKVFRPSFSPITTGKQSDDEVTNIFKSTAVKLVRETKKPKARHHHHHHHKSHKRKKKNAPVEVEVQFESGRSPVGSPLNRNKRSGSIAGPKAVAKRGSDEAAEDTSKWGDRSVFIDSDESDEDDVDDDIAGDIAGELTNEQEEAPKAAEKEDIDDLLRDVMGFDAMKI